MGDSWLGREREVPLDDEIAEEPQSVTLTEGISFVVRKLGLPVPQMSHAEIAQAEVPKDPSNLSDNDLTGQMSLWTRIMSYTRYELGKADVEKAAKLNQYNRQRALLYLELRSQGGNTEEEIRQKLKSNVQLSKHLKAAEVAAARYKLLEALFFGYRQNYTMLSRELTKRGLIVFAEVADTE